MTKTPPFRDRAVVTAAAVIVAGAGSTALLLGAAEDETLWPSIGIGAGVLAFALILALRYLGFNWFSAPVVYLSYLWVFHFPLALLTSLSDDIALTLPPYIYQWTLDPGWYRAALIALTSAAAFTAGISVFSGWPVNREPDGPWNHDSFLTKAAVIEAIVGGVLILFSIAQAGGAEVFHLGYGDLFDTVFAGPFSNGVFLLTFGIPIALAGCKPSYFKVLFGAQILFTFFMLLLGARSAALFGPLMTVMVLSKRGVRVPRWVMAAAFIAVLWVIAIVSVARQGGVRDNLETATAARPVDALLEMGGSLYTVSLFDSWVLDGDALQMGASYWLPFERAIGLVIPSVRSDLHSDPRAASEVLLSRTSGLGGSAVAEAHYNFGPFAFMFFLPIGWLIVYLDRSARSAISTAWLVVMFYPLLLEVRGWFISVPAITALGAVPLLVLTAYNKRRISQYVAAPALRPRRGPC